MRPFFSYYGAKYTASRHLGPPRRSVVVEPFAGSACYSTRWNVSDVRLFDVSTEICELWDFLINCSSRDIQNIPDSFENIDQVLSMPTGPQMLCRFWLAKGRAEPSGKISPWYREFRGASDCRVWGSPVKDRIVTQKPLIKGWSIDQMSWDQVPIIDAHWHVDPPYNNKAGSKYPHSKIDFQSLGAWCKNLPGSVDVCENDGADWLDFEPLCEVVSSRGRRSGAVSKESVWRKEGDE